MKKYKNTNFGVGAKLALKNAKDHIQVARSAEKISLGIANSHLILAAEEAIKADALSKLSVNDEWHDYIDLKAFFTSHKHKHTESYLYQMVDNTISNIFDTFVNSFEEINQLDISKEEKKEMAMEYYKSGKFMAKVDEKNKSDDTVKDWWDKANNDKNLGLYVSLNEKDGIWNGPFDIGLVEFDRSIEIVTKFIGQIEPLLELD